VNLFGHRQSISQLPKYPQTFVSRHSFQSYAGLPVWDRLPCESSLAHLTRSRLPKSSCVTPRCAPLCSRTWRDGIRYDVEGYLGAHRAQSLASRFMKDVSFLDGSGPPFWQLWSKENSSVETATDSRHIADLFVTIFWTLRSRSTSSSSDKASLAIFCRLPSTSESTALSWV